MIVMFSLVPGWVVDSAEDITEESLSLFTVLDPKLDVLIIGYGSRNTTTSRNPVDPKVIMKMRQKGINVEVLTTENAISTYNYLVEEGRVVAAALIPPSFVRLVDSDIVETKERKKQLYGDGNINFLGSNKDSHPFTAEQMTKKYKD